MTAPLYAYIVVFSGLSSQEMTDKLDRLGRTIPNWYRPPLRNTVFVVCALPAVDLTKFLRGKIKELDNLLVVDASTDRNGWLAKSAWDFLKTPKRAGEDD